MSKHTQGPWRWEFNKKHKTVNLVGGRPMFDLTVMDFARWGMGGAVPRFRDTSQDGLDLMNRLCDKPDWIEPEAGREHHKSWHQLVAHPDARLIAAAPELLEALKDARRKLAWFTDSYPQDIVVSESEFFEPIDAAIAKAEGQ